MNLNEALQDASETLMATDSLLGKVSMEAPELRKWFSLRYRSGHLLGAGYFRLPSASFPDAKAWLFNLLGLSSNSSVAKLCCLSQEKRFGDTSRLLQPCVWTCTFELFKARHCCAVPGGSCLLNSAKHMFHEGANWLHRYFRGLCNVLSTIHSQQQLDNCCLGCY